MPMTFPLLSFDEANPFITGIMKAQQQQQNYQNMNEQRQKYYQSQQLFPQELIKAKLMNALLNTESKYAEPKAQAALLAQQLSNSIQQPYATNANQVFNTDMRSKQAAIAEAMARSGLYGKQAQGIGFKLQHPGLMGGPDTKDIEVLKLMGIVPQNFQQQVQMQSPQQPVPPQSQSGFGQNTPLMMRGVQGASEIQPQIQQQIQNAQSPLNDQNGRFNTGNPLVNSILNRKIIQSEYQDRMLRGYEWSKTPADAKMYQIAQLAGGGYDINEAVKQLSEGKSMDELMQAKGYSPGHWPDPDFPATKGNIQQLKQRQVALEESNHLEKFISDGLGPYVQTIGNMSPIQIKDALTGQNEDRQAKFVAAMMLAPEMGDLRLRLAGAQVGIEAQRQILDRALANVDINQMSISKKVYKKAAKLTTDELNSMFNAANKIYITGNKNENKQPVSQRNSMDKDYSAGLNVDQNNPMGL